MHEGECLEHCRKYAMVPIVGPDSSSEGSFLAMGSRLQMKMILYDYRSNLPLYPVIQAYFRDRRPPTLIVWGKNDKIFPADGAHPYKRDLPDVEFNLIDTGHFALEDKADEIVPLIRDFLGRRIARQ
jgi:pimeloyl-ACP methyl ester carboxylesterase